MKYLAKYAENCGYFAVAGRLLIYSCGRIIQNSMSDQAATQGSGFSSCFWGPRWPQGISIFFIKEEGGEGDQLVCVALHHPHSQDYNLSPCNHSHYVNYQRLI